MAHTSQGELTAYWSLSPHVNSSFGGSDIHVMLRSRFRAVAQRCFYDTYVHGLFSLGF